MGYGKLNIWIRSEDCSLVQHCWQSDLMIKTCSGKYLVDLDPTVLEKLKTKYPAPDYEVYRHVTSEGEPRIKIRHGDPEISDKQISLIEVEVPPGCYVIWTRACLPEYHNNETNKVMVLVNCDEDACVNLILNSSKTCVKEMLYPGALLAIKKKIPEEELRITVKDLMEIAEMPKKDFIEDLQQKLEDLKYLIDMGKEEAREYLDNTEILLKVVNSLCPILGEQ